MLQKERYIKLINSKSSFIRQKAIKKLCKLDNDFEIKDIAIGNFASTYYYSIMSPTMCAYNAKKAGVCAAIVNDYGSVKGYKEFNNACKLLNLKNSYGYHVECKPIFNEKKATIYGYGVPLNSYKYLQNDLEFSRKDKYNRVLSLTAKVNSRLKKYNIKIDFKDVLNVSSYNNGGSVTEKHLAEVLAKEIIKNYKTGESVLEFLNNSLKIKCDELDERYLLEENNTYILQDLARVLYNNIEVFKAVEILRDVSEYVELNKNYGVITAYKIRVEEFDKEKLLNVINTLKEKEIYAVAFSEKYYNGDIEELLNFFIENETLPILINRVGMLRQVIENKPSLLASLKVAYALIGNSNSANVSVKDSFYGEQTILKLKDFKSRLEIFNSMGRD